MKVIFYFNLIILIACSGCQNNPSKESSLKKENKNLCFEYTNRNNGRLKFIKFFKDSVVWGSDSESFMSTYFTCREIESLQPDTSTSGYNVRFSENYIIVDILEEAILSTSNLKNSGKSKMFFSLKNNDYFSMLVYSIDYNQEYILTNEFEVTDRFDSKYPLVITTFPTRKDAKYQSIKIPFDDEESNKISRIKWSKQKITIYYNDSNNLEKEELLKIEI